MADTPVQMLTGTIVDTGSGLGVDVRGSTVSAGWVGGYVPVPGDLVRVLIVSGIATVLGPLFLSARPMSGTVTAASSGEALVSTDIGTVTARYRGSAPSALSVVRLDWSTSEPWILGTIVDTPTPPDEPKPPKPPKPPRPSPTTGVLTISAGWSGSYRPSPYSKWESGDVKQGAYGGGVAYEGLWGGYSQAKLKSLSGKTITKAQLHIGKRLRIGNYNSALTLRVFRSSTTGKGNPNTADGPYTESIPGNAGSRWITLSDSFGNALKDGGSVSIQGGSYGGVQGRSSNAQSGTLRIYWKKG